MGKNIKCSNCGWEWDKKDSDSWDMYVCHKCDFNNENVIKGGLSDGKTISDLIVHHGKEFWTPKQFESLGEKIKLELEKGIKIEKEHTDDNKIAHEIAMDHLWEDPEYYTKLKSIEENRILKLKLRNYI